MTSDILNYLQTRRSVSVRKLDAPGPSRDQITQILEIAARTPDHGKMVPYYFVVFEGKQRENLGKLLRESYKSEDPSATQAKLDLEAERFMRAPVVIGVISRMRTGRKPQWEQLMTAGAVAMNVSHAAHAMGFGCNWLTEWYSYNTAFKDALGLEDGRDHVAGFIYIGTQIDSMDERDRPNLDEIVTYWEEGATLNKGDVYNQDKCGFPEKNFTLYAAASTLGSK